MTSFGNTLIDTAADMTSAPQDIVIFPAPALGFADGAGAVSAIPEPETTTSTFMSGFGALRESIAFMLTLFTAHFGQPGTGAKAASMARHIRRDIRALYRQEKSAMAALIKQALRSCPEWQARVFEDLGGMPALKRWEGRLMRAFAPPPKEDYSWLEDDPDTWPLEDEDKVKPRRRKPRVKRGPRLDRNGVFRWASIKQSREQRHARRCHVSRRDYQRASTFFKDCKPRQPLAGPWPIEVMPSDLLDPAEPEDMITLTINPHAVWDRLMALPLTWLRELGPLGKDTRPKTGQVLLCPD